MAVLPLALSLAAAAAQFVGASYVISRYRQRYEGREIRAALVIGAATFLLCLSIYGQHVFPGKNGEEVAGWIIVVILVLAAFLVFTSLRTPKPR